MVAKIDPKGQSKASIAKLSSSWLVKPSSVELRLALIKVITLTPTHVKSRFEPLLDYLESLNLVWKLYLTKLGHLAY